jgi:aspartyl/glutamyl-tRNA(Asn/Gln) amidotransferase C subunit
VPTREEVLAIARLARLVFTTDELDRMAGELQGILGHVDVLRQLTATGDSAPPVDGNHVALEHAAGGVLSRTDVTGADPLSMPPSYLAPEWHDGFFTVPRLPAHGRDPG